MTLRKISASLVLLLPLLFLSVGCPKNSSPSPSDAYSVANNSAATYADVVGELISVGKTLYDNKQLDTNEYRVVMSAASELNVYGFTFLDTINRLHNDGAGSMAYLTAANTIVNEVQQLNVNQALHVKNPIAQARLNTALQAISNFLTQISGTIASATSVQPTLVSTPIPVAPTPAPQPVAPTPAPAPEGGK